MSKDTQQHKKYKILLIGEICLDVYNIGEVSRISPEAPVPVLRKTKEESRVGMAGNVFKNIKSMLPEASIDSFSNNPEDIKKIRFIDEASNYQIMRYDIEESISPLKITDLGSDLSDYSVVVISDYDKGYLTSKFIKEFVKELKNTKVFVDSKKSNLEVFENCIIKINEKESKKVKKTTKENLDMIVTLGPRGCTYQGKLFQTNSVEVYDVCGAGDVFLSALVCRWLETNDMNKSIKTANSCAALSVTKLGCYTIKREEYENLRF